uniref:Uncharacterized protein n=1 Tax=Anguilla anguilla TaxID=7936 RepID=A0A0E9XUA3_ANGAN
MALCFHRHVLHTGLYCSERIHASSTQTGNTV